MRIKIHQNYHKLILICCCFLTGCIHGMEGGTTGSFIGPLSNSLGVGISFISMYITIKGISMVIFTPLASKMIHRFNLRIVLSSATLMYILSLITIARTETLIMLYTSAVIMGISASFLSTIIVPTLINNWFVKRQGFALGIAFGFSGISGATIAPLISRIIENFGWRTGYYAIAGIIALTLLPLMFFVVRLNPEEMGLEPYGGRKVTRTDNIESVPNTRIKNIMKSRVFIYMLIFSISLALSNGILFSLPNYVKTIGMPIAFGATLTSLALLGATSFKVIFGSLNDRYSSKIVVKTAVLIGIMGLLAIYLARFNILIMSFGAFFYGAIISLMTLEVPIITKLVFGAEQYISMLVIFNMSTQLSYALGPTIYAVVFDISKSYFVSFAICIGFVVTSLLACILSLKESAKVNKVYLEEI